MPKHFKQFLDIDIVNIDINVLYVPRMQEHIWLELIECYIRSTELHVSLMHASIFTLSLITREKEQM